VIHGLDFMMTCIGIGILIVCVAWATKILNEIRIKSKAASRELRLVQHKDEPIDPMGQRLQEFRDAQFGMPMTPKPRSSAPPVWPVVRKKEQKKQGGK